VTMLFSLSVQPFNYSIAWSYRLESENCANKPTLGGERVHYARNSPSYVVEQPETESCRGLACAPVFRVAP